MTDNALSRIMLQKYLLSNKIIRRRHMPLVIVEALEGRTVEQKRGLVKDITDAVCKNFKTNPEIVTVLIHEVKGENISNAGKLMPCPHKGYHSLS